MRALVSATALLCAALVAGSCSRVGSDLLEDGTLGLQIQRIRGDGQRLYANQLTRVNLTVRVTGTDGKTAVPGATILFEEVSSVGAEILSPSAETNLQGYASTPIRAPNDSHSTDIKIRATVDGTTSSTVFTIRVNDTEAGSRYSMETLGGGIEVAGVPFQMIISILDDSDTVLTEINDTRILTYQFIAASSWGGVAPTLLPSVAVCAFTGGVCLTSAITLTDAVNDAQVWVGDGPTGLHDVFAQTIQVLPNSPTTLMFANGAGGPAAGRTILTTSAQILMSADDPVRTIQGVITDVAGNYVQDAASGTWAVANEQRFDTTPFAVITPYLSTTNGPATQLTPTRSGRGDLSLAVGGYTTATKQLIIEPGTPFAVNPLLENGGVALPGQMLGINFEVVDQKGNPTRRSNGTSPINGNYDVVFTLASTFNGQATGSVIDSGTPVSGGCSGIVGMVPVTTGGFAQGVLCTSKTWTTPFFQGVPGGGPWQQQLMINDATAVTPVLTVAVRTSSAPLTYLRGSTPISVALGPPNHLNLLRDRTDTGTWGCGVPYLYQGSWLQNCQIGTLLQGSPPARTFYAGDPTAMAYLTYEDAGGNFLGFTSASNVTIGAQFQPDWVHNIANYLGSPNSEFTVTPTVAGAAYVVQVADALNGFTSNFQFTTLADVLDHYDVATIDGANVNIVTATSSHNLRIRAFDRFNNAVFNSSIPSSRQFQLSYAGTTASPLGTAARIPNPAVPVTLTFVSGEAMYNQGGGGLLIPNSNNSVTITALDVTTGATVPAATQVPILLPGIPRTIALRTASGGAGANVGGGTFAMDTDNPRSLYLALYDRELNNVTSPTGVWDTVALSALAGVSVVTNSYVDVDADVIGSAVLSVSAPGETAGGAPTTLTTSTTVNINPGALSYIDLATTGGGNETVGTAFDVTAVLRDADGNAKVDIDGPVSVNLTISGSVPTTLGFTFTGPTGTAMRNFTDGVLSVPLNYIFYNSAVSPTIQLTTLGKSDNVILMLASGTLDHLRLRSLGGGNYLAGDDLNYEASASDQWGNSLSTGGLSTAPLNFSFTSVLGGQDISFSTLASPSDISGLADNSITGNLVNGTAQIRVKATQTGLLAVTGSLTGYAPPNGIISDQVSVQPRPTITSIDWDPSFPPPPTYVASATNSIDPFKVRLKDTYGNVITTNSSTNVVLTLSGNTRSLTGTTSLQATSGVAFFTGLKYAKAETITLRATEQTTSNYVEQAISVVAGAAVQTIVKLPGQTLNEGVTSLAAAITGTPTDQAACSPFTATIYAVDAGFNVVASYVSAVGITSNDSKATLPGGTNFALGVANFTLTNRVSGAVRTLTPTSGLGTNNVSSNYAANPGAASHVLLLLPGQTLDPGAANVAAAISGSSTTQTAGSQFAVTANLTDACFNVVNNSTNTVSLTGFGAGTTIGTWPAQNVTRDGTQTFASGAASFNVTMYKTTASSQITPANDGGFASNLSESLTVQNGTPASLVFTSFPVSTPAIAAGTNLGIVVRIKDVYNNDVDTGAGNNATIALSKLAGGGTLSGTVSKAAVSGVASFLVGGDANIRNVSTGNTIQAAAASLGLTQAGPNAFDITFNSFDHFLVSGVPSPIVAGTPASFTVTAQDVYDNTVTNYASTAYFTSDDTQVVFSPTSNLFVVGDQGTKTFTNGVTLKSAGTRAIHARITSAAGAIRGSQTGITVNPNSATTLAGSGTSSGNAGACLGPITVTSQDDYLNSSGVGANTDVTVGGTIGSAILYTAAGCGTQVSGWPATPTVTIPSGQSSVQFYLRDTAKETLNLTFNAGGFAQGSKSVTISHDPSTLAMTTVAGNAQTGTVGTALGTQIEVHLQDTYGNPAVGVNVSFAATQGSVSQATVATGAGGNAATTWTLGNARPPTTHNASASYTPPGYSLLSQAFTATANTGAATKLAYSTQPVVNAASGKPFATQPVVLIQDSLNNTVTTDSTTVVTLSGFSNTGCSTTFAGGFGFSLSSNTATASSGVATFSGLAASFNAGSGDLGVCFKATGGGLTAVNTSGGLRTVFDSPLFTDGASFAINAGASRGFPVTGGRPTGTCSVTTNNSGSPTGPATCATSGAPYSSGTYNYTAGVKGGVSDTITFTDSSLGAGGAAVTTITVNVTGGNLGWSGATYGFGAVAADTSSAPQTLTNNGNAISGTIAVSIVSCTKNGAGETCSNMWDTTGVNCGGATLAQAATCDVTVTFKGTTGTTVTSGANYTAKLRATANSGGTVDVDLTASVP